AGQARPEHVPLGWSRPPPSRVAHTVGGLQGQAALRRHRACGGRERHFAGVPLWGRGSGGRTGGLAAPGSRASIRQQGEEETRQEPRPRQGLATLAELLAGLATLAAAWRGS